MSSINGCNLSQIRASVRDMYTGYSLIKRIVLGVEYSDNDYSVNRNLGMAIGEVLMYGAFDI